MLDTPSPDWIYMYYMMYSMDREAKSKQKQLESTRTGTCTGTTRRDATRRTDRFVQNNRPTQTAGQGTSTRKNLENHFPNPTVTCSDKWPELVAFTAAPFEFIL